MEKKFRKSSRETSEKKFDLWWVHPRGVGVIHGGAFGSYHAEVVHLGNFVVDPRTAKPIKIRFWRE